MLSILLYGAEAWSEHSCRKIYGSLRPSTCSSSVRCLGYASMISPEILRSSLLPTFSVFRTSTPGGWAHYLAMLWDMKIAHQLTIRFIIDRESMNWLFPQPWVAPGSTALLVDTADQRRCTLRHSCWMVQGSLAVVDTPGWRNGTPLSDDDDDDGWKCQPPVRVYEWCQLEHASTPANLSATLLYRILIKISLAISSSSQPYEWEHSRWTSYVDICICYGIAMLTAGRNIVAFG